MFPARLSLLPSLCSRSSSPSTATADAGLLRIICCFILLLTVVFQGANAAHYDFSEHSITKMVWCTKNLEEQYKCKNLTMAITRDRDLFDDAIMELVCLMAYSAEECIHNIDMEKADITTLDAGDVFIAGRFNSLIPIMQERYYGDATQYYSVAVVKANTLKDVNSLADLKQKKACFPWVGSMAGWIVPIYMLQREGEMEVVDCNNQVKTAANYFNDSCAVFALTDRYNPIGDNSDKLCALCTGKISGGRCTTSDPYYGYDGAFRCLLESGEVAFLRHYTVPEMLKTVEFKNLSPERFELLCRDGRRAPINDYQQCNWGAVPSDAVVTSSARNIQERKKYQRFLNKIVEFYSDKKEENGQSQQQQQQQQYQSYNNNYYDRQSGLSSNAYRNERLDSSFTSTTSSIDSSWHQNTSIPYEKFNIFESSRYDGGASTNLLFQDIAQSLLSINEDYQSFSNYLQKSIDLIYGLRECPVPTMTLCVTSDPELEKCVQMKIALKAQLLKPELVCKKMHSHINCMQWIKAGKADIAVFDAGDIYTGGLYYNLIPIMSEVYNLGVPEYYVVALAKEEDPDTELTYLKGKYTCHAGINTAAGWTYPMALLISNGWIRPYGCDSVRAAAEYFTKSCIPGAISNEYNTGVPYDNMCDLCHGSSYRYCRRDASEDYYGHTGAFRCLVEGGGDVAFVKHTTVMENTGGKRKEWWARNALNDDFELLCTDGTRAELHEYKRCNLGKVKANAIVARGGSEYNETQINAYLNLLMYAQQLYGRKNVDDFSFSMFSSAYRYYDLIFQDATRQLQIIPPEKRRYDIYLGKDYMRARRITDCYAAASKSTILSFILLTSTISIQMLLSHSNILMF